MKAIQFESFEGRLRLVDLPDPSPADDGVVIRVHATGLCRSDWHGWMGHDSDVRLPHVPGHEFAGVVQAIGSAVHDFRVGDRVTVPFSVGCGHCPTLPRGGTASLRSLFPTPGFTANGSFAELVAIPHADLNLVRLPDSLGMVAAASLGCRNATAYHALTKQARLQPGPMACRPRLRRCRSGRDPVGQRVRRSGPGNRYSSRCASVGETARRRSDDCRRRSPGRTGRHRSTCS